MGLRWRFDAARQFPYILVTADQPLPAASRPPGPAPPLCILTIQSQLPQPCPASVLACPPSTNLASLVPRCNARFFPTACPQGAGAVHTTMRCRPAPPISPCTRHHKQVHGAGLAHACMYAHGRARSLRTPSGLSFARTPLNIISQGHPTKGSPLLNPPPSHRLARPRAQLRPPPAL